MNRLHKMTVGGFQELRTKLEAINPAAFAKLYENVNSEEGWGLPRNNIPVIESVCNEFKRDAERQGYRHVWDGLYKRYFNNDPSCGIIKIDEIKNVPAAGEGVVFETCMMGLWRTSRNVFRFDPSLYQILKNTEYYDLPFNCLDQYPYWSTYIEIPDEPFSHRGKKEILKGLLVTSSDAMLFSNTHPWKSDSRGFIVTTFAEDYEKGEIYTSTTTQIGGSSKNTLGYGIINSSLEKNPLNLSEVWSIFWLTTNLLLYINTYLQTIYNENNNHPNQQLKPKEKGKNFKWVAAHKNTIWRVGIEVGERIRAYNRTNTSGSHASKSPHIRRAHWHTYLTGPRTNPVPILKWIPPIPIAMPREDQHDN